MTVNIPNIPSVSEIKLNMVELKLDRLIDEMRCLRSRTSAFDTRLRGIEAVSRSERTERTTARKQNHAVVGGRC
jgi:hypothetical protein